MAGSISDAERRATATEKRPEAWLMRVESLGHGVETDEPLTREQMADEFLLMGLRLAEGIDPARYARLAGRPLDPRRVALLREQGAVETTRERHAAGDARGLSRARRRGRRSRGVRRADVRHWPGIDPRGAAISRPSPECGAVRERSDYATSGLPPLRSGPGMTAAA